MQIYKRAQLKTNLLFIVLLSLLQISCATYQGKVRKARHLLASGQVTASLAELKELANKPGKDQLVHVLDYALALQVAGNFKESTKYFLLADNLVNLKDYFSVSKFVGSMLLNEEMVQYKGDIYEILLINTMLAINFVAMNDFEGARVETRKSTNKINWLLNSGKKSFSLNPFVLYLNGLIWEKNRDWDDAYIDYKKLFKARPDLTFLVNDIIRVANKSGRKSEARRLGKQYGVSSKVDNQSEIILIFQQGWGPRKVSHYQDSLTPMLVPSASNSKEGLLSVSGVGDTVTQVIYNVERDAIKAYNAQIAPLLAKRLAAIAAKKALAKQIAKKDEGLGVLADLVMTVAERADLRQWSFLPKTIQIAKVKVAPGTYDLSVKSRLNSNQWVSLDRCAIPKVSLRRGEMKIVTCRSF